MKEWRSCAEWPEGVIIGQEDDISTDSHHEENQAEAVCKMLQQMGFGGDGKVFPLRTWVEKRDEDETILSSRIITTKGRK